MNMKLYHPLLALFLVLTALLGACDLAPAEQAVLQVQILGDGQTYQVQVSPQSTVQDALEFADLTLGSLDRIDPPLHIALIEGMQVTITRVYEEFEIEEVVIPFEQQMQPSEFLTEGDQQPLQLGENGLREITYRIVYEDGIEVSKTEIKSAVLAEPVPQIMLVGVQASFTPLQIPGRLLYLSDGNAWMMEGTTANRTVIVSSGDLDGRVFSISDNGQWLLFTRHSDDEDIINTLWVVNINDPQIEIDLLVENVIHFADWQPGSTNLIAASTVESRQAAPGWQANNDILISNFSANGWVDPSPTVMVETNSGGVYGWWGMDFDYGLNAEMLVYAGPDQIGTIDIEDGTRVSLLDIVPLKTLGDWAWVPGMRWGPAGNILFTVRHAPPEGAVSPEESPVFNLTAIPMAGGDMLDLVSQVGMFAYPLPSPLQPKASGEVAYQVAYLQAIFPDQSETSRYRLVVMDRDGSNRDELFPPPEAPGIEPQRDWAVWAPLPIPGSQGYTLAVLYQGNIWLVDSATGQAWQITGDGRINNVDWRLHITE
jgi:resuscitation-promoting factor RpfB